MKSKKTEFQLTIINKLKNLRQERQISQVQIVDIIGLNSAGQVGNIESPKFKHKYTLKQIHDLCLFFDYPIEQLFLNETELQLSASEQMNILILKLIAYHETPASE